MTAYPLIQFVSAPRLDADVRFDLNPTGYKGEFSIGAPTFDADADAIDPQLGLRQVIVSVFLDGDKPTVRAQQSQLARELMRARNWLLFQLTPSSPPCWFHTYRSAGVDVSFERVHVGSDTDLWTLPLTIDADPDIWGERIDLPTATVTGNAELEGGALTVLPDIKGDLPAPLIVRIDDPSELLGTLAVTALPDGLELTAPLMYDAGQWFPVTDTSTDVTPPSDMMHAAVPRTTFATDASFITRLAGGGGQITSADVFAPVAGRFAAIMRLGQDGGSLPSTYKIRLGQASGADYVWNDAQTFTIDADSVRRWVYLGEVSSPYGHPLPDSYLDEYTVDGELKLAVQVQRVSGTGQLVFDGTVLIPVHMPGSAGSSMTVVTPPEQGPDGYDTLVVDSEERRLVPLEDGGTQLPLMTSTGSVVGGFLFAHPGSTNVLHLLHGRASYSATQAADRPLTDTTDVHVSYHPRWLFLPSEL